jgi:hypothetical protein
MADGGMMANGGKVNKKWIQDAIKPETKGALRATAKRKGLLKGDEKLSKTDLHKLEKMGGKTARRARLAETLKSFADGGKVGDSGTVEAANYNQYTGIIKEIRKSNLSVNLGNGIKGTESDTYATIIDENGKERFGILI